MTETQESRRTIRRRFLMSSISSILLISLIITPAHCIEERTTHFADTILSVDPYWPGKRRFIVPSGNIGREQYDKTTTENPKINALLEKDNPDPAIWAQYPDMTDEILLLLAAQRGWSRVVDDILSRGFPVDNEISAATENKYGFPCITAMQCAAWFGQSATLRQLIQSGADPNFEPRNKMTPLHCTINGEYWQAALLLINHGVDVNAYLADTYAPLHHAAHLRHPLMVELFIRAGAEVNRRDKDGFTPLHYATGFDKPYVVKTLILYGADINAKGDDGRTPRDTHGIFVYPEPDDDSFTLKILDHYRQKEISDEVRNYAAEAMGQLDPTRRANAPSVQWGHRRYDSQGRIISEQNNQENRNQKGYSRQIIKY